MRDSTGLCGRCKSDKIEDGHGVLGELLYYIPGQRGHDLHVYHKRILCERCTRSLIDWLDTFAIQERLKRLAEWDI